MKDELISILTKLISLQSTNDNQLAITECFDFIDSQLAFYPFVKHIYNHNGVESRVWTTAPGKNFEYILNAHIDVVPAATEMFSLKIEGDTMKGRGVSDMKFAVASYILALKEILKQKQRLPKLAIMITSDEERGGANGVGYLVNEEKYRANCVIIPDGGDNNKIVENAKGVVQIEVKATGVSAHGSKPWEGESANDKIIEAAFLIRQKFPQLKSVAWENTVNIGKIVGGAQTNMVADSASLFLDIRFLPEFKSDFFVEEIRKLCPWCVVVKVISGDAFHIDRRNPYIAMWVKLLSPDNSDSIYMNETSATDGRYFTTLGMPVVVSKPVGGLIHHPDEYVSLSSTIAFISRIISFLK